MLWYIFCLFFGGFLVILLRCLGFVVVDDSFRGFGLVNIGYVLGSCCGGVVYIFGFGGFLKLRYGW